MAKALIPDEVLDGDVAVIARKGAGKSYLLRGRVERLLQLNRQVLVFDPMDIWWGLKQKADGSPGFPIIVIGGEHGDLPLDPARAVDLAGFFATHDSSAVIDVSGMLIEPMREFVSAFLEELYRANRKPLWLVLEEADVFAPQQPASKLTRAMHDQVDRIVRRGRNFGFRVWTATQRPARLSKDVLTQADTLFLLQISGPQDRDAADAWISGHAEPAQAAEIRGSLASLAVGEGYLWSPRLDLLQRMKFPAITTLDTSATPQAGDRRQLKAGAMAKGDVAALVKALASPDQRGDQLLDQASAGNRASDEHLVELDEKLRADLERKAYDRGYAASEADHAGLPTYQDGWHAGAIEVQELLKEQLLGLVAGIDKRVATYRGQLAGRPDGPLSEAIERTPRKGATPSPDAQPSPAPPAKQARTAAAGGAGPSANSSMHERLLQAIRGGPRRSLSWREVAVLAGVSSVSGPFRAGRNSLLASGDVRDVEDGTGNVILSDRPHEGTITAEQVRDLWLAKLPSMAVRVFGHLFDVGSDTPAHAAEVLQVSGISGPYRGAWKALRNNNLVEPAQDKAWRLARVLQELKDS